jgi:hypothetical protein
VVPRLDFLRFLFFRCFLLLRNVGVDHLVFPGGHLVHEIRVVLHKLAQTGLFRAFLIQLAGYRGAGRLVQLLVR